MLTACGIETLMNDITICIISRQVATVLTACGIETRLVVKDLNARFVMLQQCLPLAVLKLADLTPDQLAALKGPLQQCLPLAVLKPSCGRIVRNTCIVATVLTACGIETNDHRRIQ